MLRTDYDVVVVGSGAAGLMAAAIAVGSVNVGLLTDRGLGTSNSAVAQGGLQYPESDRGSVDRFRQDMVASGGDSIDRARLDHFVESVREVVDVLQGWGLELDRDPSGALLKLSAGGLCEPRVVTSGDRIGTAILTVLRRRVLASTVDVRTRTKVLDIKVGVDTLTLMTNTGPVTTRSVIVATGGRSYEFAQEQALVTSNPANDNGRMHGVLRGLGLDEIEPESFQFHPYGIVDADGVARGRCVPESITSMGAYVADRFGKPIVSSGADRLVVNEAIRKCLERGDGIEVGSSSACVLALSEVDDTALLDRYPHLKRTLDGRRLDNGDIPVRPVVHYQLGGFDVDPNGSTVVPGLYLAGEVTGGLHGRNRLMGNGITEAVVDGWTAARTALDQLISSTLS